MSRTSASLATAALMLVLASAPAGAGSTDYLLELGGVDGESSDDKHKNQIEILSYSWGATQADAMTDGLLIMRANEQPAPAATGDMTLKGSKIGENAPAAGGRSKTSKVESISIKQGMPAGAAATDGMLIVRGVGAQPAAPGGVQVAAGDVDGDGRADKRMHKPRYVPAPLAKGSVTVRGKFPGCVVGTRYPTVRLGNASKRYTLQDAVITSCTTVPGGALPMEQVSMNYAKIKLE